MATRYRTETARLDLRLLHMLKSVAKFAERGFGPSLRELKDDTPDTTSTSVVTYRLDALQGLGLIDRDAIVARSTRLTPAGWRRLTGELEGDTS